MCNAAKGEPATFKDRPLLPTNPCQVLAPSSSSISPHALAASGSPRR